MQSFGIPPQTKSLLSLEHVSPKTQIHLKNTYTTLFLFSLAASLGCLVQQYLQISTFWLSLLGFVFLFASFYQKGVGSSTTTRLYTLCAFTFCQGFSIGPLVQYAAFLDPALPLYALGGTSVVFACFSLFALVSKRREYIYLGAICSSVLGIFFWMSLLNMFFRSSTLNLVQLYGGLLLFAAYVVYDTQMIVEKSELGSNDYVSHALELFLDAFALFVRILIILSRNREKKEEEKKRRRGRY